MSAFLSIRYAFEILFTIVSAAAVLAVLQTFIIGQHYIIPTGILVVAVLLGNIAWWGFQDQRWAKYVLFWCGFLLTCHGFFALFFSKRYRELLGDSFEFICGVLVIAFAWLTFTYARRNNLFSR
jgi:hypothetical protein